MAVSFIKRLPSTAQFNCELTERSGAGAHMCKCGGVCAEREVRDGWMLGVGSRWKTHFVEHACIQSSAEKVLTSKLPQPYLASVSVWISEQKVDTDWRHSSSRGRGLPLLISTHCGNPGCSAYTKSFCRLRLGMLWDTINTALLYTESLCKLDAFCTRQSSIPSAASPLWWQSCIASGVQLGHEPLASSNR